MPLGVRSQRGQLIVKNVLRLPQQAPYQGALAIIHAAAGDEAQGVLLCLLCKPVAKVVRIAVARRVWGRLRFFGAYH